MEVDPKLMLAATAELRAAHLIIRNALSLMTPAQKRKWAECNARDEVDGEFVTRANERDAILKRMLMGY